MNCGIDVIEISRVEDAVSKTPGFLQKVFTQTEIEYYEKKGEKAETLAGIFAAKEAFSKFLGTGISKDFFESTVIMHNEEGKPYIMYKGEIANVSLSISHNKTVATAMVCGDDIEVEIPLKAEMQALVPKRNAHAHKGNFGRVLVVAGSRGMVGAGVLSAYGALRTGCGLVTLTVPKSLQTTAAGFYPEIMTKGLAENDGHISVEAIPEIVRLAKESDAVVFGPGIGRNQEIFVILCELLGELDKTLVIDADGLFALARKTDILKEASCRVIVTPHEGEMSRLCGLDTEKIRADRVLVAEEFANTYGACTVLKGSGTVVCKKGERAYINPTGNCGMATAGSGDVLSGVIASLAAQGMDDYSASKLGVYIHGLAGDIAALKKGTHGLIASDIAENIPDAILKIKG